MKCEVCEADTDKCIPSPFGPYSYWRCQECSKAKRVAYKDLLMVIYGRVVGNSMFDNDLGPEYLNKYMIPTLEYYNKTQDQLFAESKEYAEKQ